MVREINKENLTLLGKDCARYFTTRLCKRESTIEDLLDIDKLILYPGIDQETFDNKMLNKNAKKVDQKGSMETIWETEPGVLEIPIYHGFWRLNRYKHGIKHLNSQGPKIFGDKFKPIELIVKEVNDDSLDTQLAFDKLRVDWIHRLEDNKEILDQFRFGEINNMCVGSYFTLKNLIQNKNIDHEEHLDPYLDYMFFEIEGKPTLLTKNMYGDQIGEIISELIHRQHFRGDSENFDIYVLTKAGGLSDRMKRGDLAIPTSYSSERSLLVENSEELFNYRKVNFQNKLMKSEIISKNEPHGSYKVSGINGVNIFSEVKNLGALSSSIQYVDVLNWAHELGCSTVDMELGAGQLAVRELKERHYDLNLSLNNMFIISDLPRFGDNLSVENWNNSRYQEGAKIGYNLILDNIDYKNKIMNDL